MMSRIASRIRAMSSGLMALPPPFLRLHSEPATTVSAAAPAAIASAVAASLTAPTS